MDSEQKRRYLLTIKMVLLALDEAGGAPLARDVLVSLTLDYGKSAGITAAEVEEVLNRSLQTIVLSQQEWS